MTSVFVCLFLIFLYLVRVSLIPVCCDDWPLLISRGNITIEIRYIHVVIAYIPSALWFDRFVNLHGMAEAVRWFTVAHSNYFRKSLLILA